MLDYKASKCGELLLYKYCASENLFSIKQEDVSKKASDIDGPKELVDKTIKAKSTTINRNKCKRIVTMSDNEKFEIQRQKKVAQEKKRVESLSSTQNTCQAIVNPQCAKYKVMKSLLVPRAITALVGICKQYNEVADVEEALKNVRVKDIDGFKKICSDSGLILIKKKCLPEDIKRNIKVVTIENAGCHYKAGKSVASGEDFIRDFEDKWITYSFTLVPHIKKMIVSDEKYTFTPDLFKASTHAQRNSSTSGSIAHLRSGDEILSEENYERASVTGTSQGKKIASTFIARNAHKLSVKENVDIIFDSELNLMCTCSGGNKCTCARHTHPIQCTYNHNGHKSTSVLKNIKQRKGEAECAQIDWVIHEANQLSRGDAILSLVSSADIDAVVLHLFAASKLLPRDENGQFHVNVYVALKKGESIDIYNITGIIALLEKTFDHRYLACQVACVLSIAGNDFLPKFQNISHLQMLTLYLSNPDFRNNMISISNSAIDREVFFDFMKSLYCPKSLDPNLLSFDEIRQLSIKPPNPKGSTKKAANVVTFEFTDGQARVRHPRLWLPPRECLDRLCTLHDAMITYLHGLGNHESSLPDFSKTCLVKRADKVEYDFGKKAHVTKLAELVCVTEDILTKQKSMARCSKKRQLESTPSKKGNASKRRHLDLNLSEVECHDMNN